MHYFIIVVGDDVETEMSPFNESLRVAPYFRKCDCVDHEQTEKLKGQPLPLDWKCKGTGIAQIVLPSDNIQIGDACTCLEYSWPYSAKGEPAADCESCQGTGIELTTENPKGKWDWYQIGGHLFGYWQLKPRRSGKFGEKSWKICYEVEPNRADQARKGDIDFEAMMVENRAEAAQLWERVQQELIDHPDQTERIYHKYDLRPNEIREE